MAKTKLNPCGCDMFIPFGFKTYFLGIQISETVMCVCCRKKARARTLEMPFISGVEITEEDIQEVKDDVAKLVDIPIKNDARGVVNFNGLVVNIRSIEAYILEAVE